jgi:hypothetical protein
VPDKYETVPIKLELISQFAAVADFDRVVGKDTVPVFDPAAQSPGQADRFLSGVNGVANRCVDVILH